MIINMPIILGATGPGWIDANDLNDGYYICANMNFSTVPAV